QEIILCDPMAIFERFVVRNGVCSVVGRVVYSGAHGALSHHDAFVFLWARFGEHRGAVGIAETSFISHAWLDNRGSAHRVYGAGCARCPTHTRISYRKHRFSDAFESSVAT